VDSERKPDLPFRPWIAALLVLALHAALGSGGCPGRAGPDFGRLPTITSDDPKAEAELRVAKASEDRGDRDAAASRYRAFLDAHPKDPLVPVAQLALGRILLASGKHADAKKLFDQVSLHPEAAISEQGRFYGAVADHGLGYHERAVQALRPMVGRPIDPVDTSLLLRTLSTALIAIARYDEAVTVLDQLAVQSPNGTDRAWAEARIVEVTKDKASREQIVRLQDELAEDGVAWPHVARRALRDADAAGDSERVRELVEAMQEQEISLDEELSAIALRADKATDADPRVIGAVLSLSGRGRRVGELALRGLMLAAGLPPTGPPQADAPRLVFRDDGGDPQRAVEAVDDLVTAHRAVAIIGPLDGRAASAAAAKARELGVPIVLLSPAGSGAERGTMVYEFFSTPEGELRQLVGASVTRGKRVAALLPEGAYGDRIATALTSVSKQLSAEVAGVVRYPTAATSFVEPAKILATQSFDTLLLADDARQVALIAPALASAGLWSTEPAQEAPSQGRAIGIVATSVAFDPSLARSAGRYLQGATFSVPFDATTAQGPAQKFAERFQAQFGERPEIFAAFAHDAYKLLRKAVDSGAKTRKAVGESLWRAQSDELAGPSDGLTADRGVRRATRLLRLRGDVFVAVE
jgi:ABC-type branched-subunit amino acid transport system substrate-binding protein